jgi:hypothetical protein
MFRAIKIMLLALFSSSTTVALAVDQAALAGYQASRDLVDDPEQARVNREEDIKRLLNQ